MLIKVFHSLIERKCENLFEIDDREKKRDVVSIRSKILTCLELSSHVTLIWIFISLFGKARDFFFVWKMLEEINLLSFLGASLSDCDWKILSWWIWFFVAFFCHLNSCVLIKKKYLSKSRRILLISEFDSPYVNKLILGLFEASFFFD